MRYKTRARTFFTFSSAGTALTLALVAGCGGSADDPEETASPPPPSASAQPGDDVTVIQPGEPGDEALTGAPASPIATEPNQADIAFVQMMVPHHAQAVEMAELAHKYAVDADVRGLAARIRAAQGPEIVSMSAWLEAHGLTADPGDGHSGPHGGSAQMMGMLTPAQMDALAAARGHEFDRLFLQGMIGHHQGALRMAETAEATGSDVRVMELAGDIKVSQTAEIALMRDMQR
jgi:uncharacterized protein (DUF305 family)